MGVTLSCCDPHVNWG